MSKKLTAVLMIVASLLITGGFLWKSGTLQATAKSMAERHREDQARQRAAADAECARKNQAEAWQKRCEQLRHLPVDGRAAISFHGLQKTLECELRPDRWSREIRLPEKYVSWTINVSPEDGHLLWFDGEAEPVELNKDDPPRNLGPRPGSFRILGKTAGQKAKITFEAQKPPF